MDPSNAPASPNDTASAETATFNPWRFCVAPMMDWTDRHCRYFHRKLSRHARMYTEMVTTGALRHGDVHRHLRFDRAEHPVALQIGGSDVPLYWPTPPSSARSTATTS
jgi:tRNA-dihydrouridine synthase A